MEKPMEKQQWEIRHEKYMQLSDDKQREIVQISTQAQAEVDAIYSPEQRQKMRAAVASGQSSQSLLDSLNLTQEQRDRIRQISQESQRRMLEIVDGE
ncbi:hypothetical protein [Phormidesmis sp. 146-33]